MRRLASISVWLGLTLLGISAFAIFWSDYSQREAQRAWYREFPDSGDTRTSGSSSSPTPEHRSKAGSGNSRSETQEDLFARLFFPRLEREVFVQEGINTSNLSKGPGWLTNTSLPGAGNTVIAGHRDTHFRFLKDVRRGDEIELEAPPRTYRFRVRSIQVVEPSNVRLLRPEKQPVLTLVTCYPFSYVGLAPRRYIVRAELVDMVYAQNKRASN